MARGNTGFSGVDGDENRDSDNGIIFYNSNRFTVEVEVSQDQAIVFQPFETKSIETKFKSKVIAYRGLQEVK